MIHVFCLLLLYVMCTCLEEVYCPLTVEYSTSTTKIVTFVSKAKTTLDMALKIIANRIGIINYKKNLETNYETRL